MTESLAAPPSKPLSESSSVSMIHVAFLVSVVLAVVGLISGGAEMISHEIAPVREDVKELKGIIIEMQRNPVPKHIYDRLDSQDHSIQRLERRLDAMEK